MIVRKVRIEMADNGWVVYVTTPTGKGGDKVSRRLVFDDQEKMLAFVKNETRR